MKLRILGGAVALVALLGSGITANTSLAQAQAVPGAPVPQTWVRGERGSERDLLHVRRRLEALIDQMQHDQRDYGGYRVQAIQALQQARQDIVLAIQYDQTHPH